jgi:hypothetical protein
MWEFVITAFTKPPHKGAKKALMSEMNSEPEKSLKKVAIGDQVETTTSGKSIVEVIGANHISVRSQERQMMGRYILENIHSRHLSGYGLTL